MSSLRIGFYDLSDERSQFTHKPRSGGDIMTRLFAIGLTSYDPLCRPLRGLNGFKKRGREMLTGLTSYPKTMWYVRDWTSYKSSISAVLLA